ncbi:MAG TPA: LysR substrate-binding domain-containing protein [Bradyrhizobium sp.]
MHACDRAIDIVGENFDIAIQAHFGPLPDSNLVQRTLASAPWYLYAGSDYLAANGEPRKPEDLQDHPTLFMTPTGRPPSRYDPESRPARCARECAAPGEPRRRRD